MDFDTNMHSAFRRTALAGAIGLAVMAGSAQAIVDVGGGYLPPTPGHYFTPFALDPDGNEPDPVALANGMIDPSGGVIVQSAAFQGNTGVSASLGGYYGGYEGGYEGGYSGGYEGGYFGAPDTVLGAATGSGLGSGAAFPPAITDDDSSPLGNGLGDALIITSASPVAFEVSGFDDFDFNGLSDGSESGGGSEPHGQQGPYVLYLSVMDGVNDPDFSGGSDPAAPDPADPYDPATHADLAIATFLGADSFMPDLLTPNDVDVFSFDPGTADSDDGSAVIEGGSVVLTGAQASDPSFMEVIATAIANGDPVPGNPTTDPNAQGLLQGFLDLLDSGSPVAAVIDNNPGGYVPTTEFMGSASFVSGMNLGTGPADEDLNFGDGILLTSGVGTPPDSNTSGSFTGMASGEGDAGLDALLAAAFEAGLIEGESVDGEPVAPQSTDATVLAFDFTVPEGANAVEFDFMFGTEEYPNWNFPDVASISIDGRNYAIFPDGTPLIFDPDTAIANLLVDNDPWGPGGGEGNAGLAIEYDGVSPVRHMVAPLADLAPGEVHTFKAAVSDARDQAFDTGLFLARFAAKTFEGGSGADPSDPVLPAPEDDPADGFDFRLELGDTGIGLDPTTPIWIDPVIAVGYEYEVINNGPNFATAILPGGYGDDLYEVWWWNETLGEYVLLDSGHDLGQFAANELIDVTSLVDPAGVIGFQVLGIEIDAQLDPNDPNAFATGVTFTSGGTVDVKMTPITQFVPDSVGVPEPGMLVLLGGGLLGLGTLRRRWKESLS